MTRRHCAARAGGCGQRTARTRLGWEDRRFALGRTQKLAALAVWSVCEGESQLRSYQIRNADERSDKHEQQRQDAAGCEHDAEERIGQHERPADERNELLPLVR